MNADITFFSSYWGDNLLCLAITLKLFLQPLPLLLLAFYKGLPAACFAVYLLTYYTATVAIFCSYFFLTFSIIFD